MYEKVIVPTDGSELSLIGLKEGMKAAKTYDIPAVAIYVLAPETQTGVGIGTALFDDMNEETINTLHEHRKKEGKKVLEKVKKIAEEMDIELDTEIKKGEPYEEITALADENDIIYMSSHGRSGISSLFIGSTTDRVIKHTESTVAVVSPTK